MAYKCPPITMKKTTLAIAFMAIFCLFMTSCSKDDKVVEPDVSLSMTNVSMYHDQTKRLSAVNATYWKSEDDFVATVDNNGLVTGCHVGSTKIVAYNGNSSATCNVTVIPRYNLYDTPILDWGASMAEIRNKERHEYSASSSTTLVYNYTHDSDNPCVVIYTFDDGSLKWIYALLKWEYFTIVGDHLLERYQPVYVDRVKQYVMYWDAYTKDKLKTVINIELMKVSDSQVLRVGYADASKASSEPANQTE